mmetsp:Transcript_7051/g.17167  ORF Transcript_7051/g.17167 Transcript_7051/m.17167 type:complete len:225 (+) Transcript_7051:615-1289(+)
MNTLTTHLHHRHHRQAGSSIKEIWGKERQAGRQAGRHTPSLTHAKWMPADRRKNTAAITHWLAATETPLTHSKPINPCSRSPTYTYSPRPYTLTASLATVLTSSSTTPTPLSRDRSSTAGTSPPTHGVTSHRKAMIAASLSPHTFRGTGTEQKNAGEKLPEATPSSCRRGGKGGGIDGGHNTFGWKGGGRRSLRIWSASAGSEGSHLGDESAGCGWGGDDSRRG